MANGLSRNYSEGEPTKYTKHTKAGLKAVGFGLGEVSLNSEVNGMKVTRLIGLSLFRVVRVFRGSIESLRLRSAAVVSDRRRRPTAVTDRRYKKC